MNALSSRTLALKDYLPISSPTLWGSDDGVEVRSRLVKEIDKLTSVHIIYLSMEGIENIDASFSREAIVKTIKNYRPGKGFCLTDIENPDYLDNLFSPAVKLEQPVFIKIDNSYQIIGPNRENAPSKTNQPILDYIQSHGHATAVELAKALSLQLTNASTKLKQLLEQGFVLRAQDSTAGPGLEYFYYPIR
ncbi:MarR family transcriptional regulator [Ketobacter sp. MCCC 1A13808]|uniref:MarR family transcriptional regulator n=1 Tax=Ketobacter sp. MCCC 1A13808 TaxID=2602738 RepID=UPI0012EB4AA3|nr:MarR family transcriptional regulator [Ketobacter sp. MCCC 1A13808]MVF12330.1 MarR family transcriptional regulator [Ketobacter sp. MCCC 1A13808]